MDWHIKIHLSRAIYFHVTVVAFREHSMASLQMWYQNIFGVRFQETRTNFQDKHFGLLLCPAPNVILHHIMKPEVGTMLVKEDSWLFNVMLNWIMTNCYSAKENDEVN